MLSAQQMQQWIVRRVHESPEGWVAQEGFSGLEGWFRAILADILSKHLGSGRVTMRATYFRHQADLGIEGTNAKPVVIEIMHLVEGAEAKKRLRIIEQRDGLRSAHESGVISQGILVVPYNYVQAKRVDEHWATLFPVETPWSLARPLHAGGSLHIGVATCP